MVDFRDTLRVPPWPVRWGLGAPVAALAGLFLYVKAWGVAWYVPSVLAVVLAAWVCGVLGQWGALRPGRERAAAIGGVGVAFGFLVFLAGWRLPSALVLTALPAGALAMFQGFLTLGRSHPVALRVAVVGGSLAAFVAVAAVPLERLAPGLGVAGPLLRYLVLAALLVGAVSIWNEAGRLKVGDGVLRVARSVLFVIGVWLPTAWWRGEWMRAEFRRPENLVFFALVVLVAWARPVAEAGGGGVRTRRVVASGALVLAAVALAGWLRAASQGWPASKAVFFGVGVASLVLAALQLWRWSAPSRPPVCVWFPELVFLVAAVAVSWV